MDSLPTMSQVLLTLSAFVNSTASSNIILSAIFCAVCAIALSMRKQRQERSPSPIPRIVPSHASRLLSELSQASSLPIANARDAGRTASAPCLSAATDQHQDQNRLNELALTRLLQPSQEDVQNQNRHNERRVREMAPFLAENQRQREASHIARTASERLSSFIASQRVSIEPPSTPTSSTPVSVAHALSAAFSRPLPSALARNRIQMPSSGYTPQNVTVLDSDFNPRASPYGTPPTTSTDMDSDATSSSDSLARLHATFRRDARQERRYRRNRRH